MASPMTAEDYHATTADADDSLPPFDDPEPEDDEDPGFCCDDYDCPCGGLGRWRR